jgi:hypothetical protein
VLCEDTSVMVSALGAGRVRRDHFKGFSKEQLHQVYRENAEVIAAKSSAKASDCEEDRLWAEQQDALRALVEEQELAHADIAAAAVEDHAATIASQRTEQAAMRASEKAAAFGAISGGLMDGFGHSWR